MMQLSFMLQAEGYEASLPRCESCFHYLLALLLQAIFSFCLCLCVLSVANDLLDIKTLMQVLTSNVRNKCLLLLLLEYKIKVSGIDLIK